MKTKLKIKLSFLFLFAFFLVGLFYSGDAFAVNYSAFRMTFTNNGSANSWVDYLLFQDTTYPFGGNFNAGDIVITYSYDQSVQVSEGVNVPPYSSVIVEAYKNNFPQSGHGVYVQYLPWKNENPTNGDSGCIDPVNNFIGSVSDIIGSDIYFTFSTSGSYTCNVPPAPVCSPPDATCPDTGTTCWSCASYGSGYTVVCNGNGTAGCASSSTPTPTPTRTPTPTPTPAPRRIQGYKVMMPGNQAIAPASGQTVQIDADPASSTTVNPYGTGYSAGAVWDNITAGNRLISVSVPDGYTVGYTLCYDVTTCHTTIPTMQNWVWVNVDAGHYADLWWHYYPPPSGCVPCSCEGQWRCNNGTAGSTQVQACSGGCWSTPTSCAPGNVCKSTTCSATPACIATTTPTPTPTPTPRSTPAPGANTLNVFSSPNVGAIITDFYGSGFGGTTDYTRTSASTINSRIDAPDEFIMSGFRYKFNHAENCRNSSGADNTDRLCDIYVTGGGTLQIFFIYDQMPANTLNVRSSPVTGVPISNSSGLAGNTNYTKYSYIDTINSRVDAPLFFASGGQIYNFSSVSGCRNSGGADTVNDNLCDVYVTDGGTQTVTFTYAAVPTPTPTITPTPTPMTYSISGAIYIDANENGVRDCILPCEVGGAGDEQGYTGDGSTISMAINGPPWNYNPKSLTANGEYTLLGFLDNTFNDLQIQIPAGYFLTSGGSNSNPRLDVAISGGAPASNIDFGIKLTPTYTISGNIVNDVNKNGQFDAGIDTNFNNHYNIKITKTGNPSLTFSSNGSGFYTQTLPAGEYLVEFNDTVPSGFSTSFPSTLSHTITIGGSCDEGAFAEQVGASCSSGNVINLNFGFRLYCSWIQTDGGDIRLDEGSTTCLTPEPPGCGSLTFQATCEGQSGCTWDPGNFCYVEPPPGGCSLSPKDTCEARSGCMWDFSSTSCYVAPPPGGCGSKSSEASCTAIAGCGWDTPGEYCFVEDPPGDPVRITNPIPLTASCIGGNNFSIDSTGAASPGIVFGGGFSPDLGGGAPSIPGWVVWNDSANPPTYNPSKGVLASSYNYFNANLIKKGVKITPISSGNIDTLDTGVYKADDSLTIPYGIPSPTLGSSKFVTILVNGNLIIEDNITVPVGSVLTFIVRGDIIISPAVGESNATSTASNLDGYYSTDRSFIVRGGNTCPTSDYRLNVRGSIIVNAARRGGSFINERTLCADNSICPAVSVKIRPDFVIFAPESIKRSSTVYQEVAP